MPAERPHSPKFEALYAHALETDMAALRGLTPEETFAVLLGALSALSLSEARLTQELRVLLDQGCPVSLAEDTLIQMAVYIGCPPARQALGCLALAAQGKGMAEPPASLPTSEERYGEGVSVYAQLNPDALSNIKGAFGDLAGDVIDLTFRGFGDLYAQSSQPLPLRQLATVSCLAVLGCAAPQLRIHIGAALNVGVTQEQLVTTIAWVQFLKGAPAAYNALTELKAALSAGSGATPGYE